MGSLESDFAAIAANHAVYTRQVWTIELLGILLRRERGLPHTFRDALRVAAIMERYPDLKHWLSPTDTSVPLGPDDVV